ncbi:FAD-dependent monooxygenase [Streptosporangium longisporum]|uniref:FAD-binding domain-containing protein n=1 Tax=Streptosporangium longisporum TaxID=46187 RepID=A0ABP6KQS1_9ACTN
MTRARTALVIGGGIAGPAAGMALRKAGITATVYEAHPSTADGVGGSLAIAPNGLSALRAIDAESAVRAIARPMPGAVMAVDRKRLGSMPVLSDLPPLQLVWRFDLHRVLHERAAACGVRIEYGKRPVNVSESASGVSAHFADGTAADADILIGADGIRSTVRTLIDPAAPGPRPTGLLGFEAIADLDVPEDPGTMVYVFGKRGYYLYRTHPGGGRAAMPLVMPIMMRTVMAPRRPSVRRSATRSSGTSRSHLNRAGIDGGFDVPRRGSPGRPRRRGSALSQGIGTDHGNIATATAPWNPTRTGRTVRDTPAGLPDMT